METVAARRGEELSPQSQEDTVQLSRRGQNPGTPSENNKVEPVVIDEETDTGNNKVTLFPAHELEKVVDEERDTGKNKVPPDPQSQMVPSSSSSSSSSGGSYVAAVVLPAAATTRQSPGVEEEGGSDAIEVVGERSQSAHIKAPFVPPQSQAATASSSGDDCFAVAALATSTSGRQSTENQEDGDSNATEANIGQSLNTGITGNSKVSITPSQSKAILSSEDYFAVADLPTATTTAIRTTTRQSREDEEGDSAADEQSRSAGSTLPLTAQSQVISSPSYYDSAAALPTATANEQPPESGEEGGSNFMEEIEEQSQNTGMIVPPPQSQAAAAAAAASSSDDYCTTAARATPTTRRKSQESGEAGGSNATGLSRSATPAFTRRLPVADTKQRIQVIVRIRPVDLTPSRYDHIV